MKGAGRQSKTWLWVFTLAMLALALMLAPSPFERAAAQSVPESIDTAAPVSDSSQCMPCHMRIGTVNKPGLIFGHGNHLMVSCDACHSRMPHGQGATDSVPMDTCFACHGVKHGPQGDLATSECRKCHSPSFDLKPANHRSQKAFAAKGHADLSHRIGVNRCMMCHKASEDCNECHQKKQVKIPELPDAYVSLLSERPKRASVKVYPTGPTSMAQCQYCHPDLDDIVPGKLVFAHAAHLGRAYPCETCHPRFGHTMKGPDRPDMQSCYRCHGMQHQGNGQIAAAACSKCHPPGFDLEPANHTSKFIAGEHSSRASNEPAYCAMCHKNQFCVECHQGRSKSANAPRARVVPASHRKGKWRATHGGLFLAKKGDCGACHDDASCRLCHKTTMPHPANWIQKHAPEPGVRTTDCDMCHTDRRTCQDCHHKPVMSVELVASNCVPCHKPMAQLPPTSIQNKGFAEHAVHFNVGKDKKKKPFRCFECHVSFGPSGESSKHTVQQGHDLRLCYSCHGQLDPVTHEQIAKYPGAQLCARCHANLNF